MYAVAERLDPDTYFALARATYREMAAAGITTVGRVPLPAPPARRHAVRRPERDGPRAASRRPREAGIRIALLDTCYLVAAGSASRPRACSVRYSDGDADALGRARRRPSRRRRRAVIGAAIHSVRAVPRDQLPTVVEAAAGRPLHVHLSEQVAENDACLAAYGVTPTAAARTTHGVLGPLTTRRARHPPDRRRHRAPRRDAAPTPASARPPSATSATASGPAGGCTTPGAGSRSAATATR